MKFQAEILKNVIGKCTRFSTDRGLIPEYGYLGMRGGYIQATNGIIGIKYRNPVTFTEEFDLPAKLFSEYLNKVNCEVEMVGRGDNILLKARSLQAKIPKLKDEHKINIDIPPDDAKIPLPDEFGDSLRRIMFSVPKDGKTKESLRGVNYDGKSFYSSDNIKLSRFTPKFKLDNQFFIPAQLLEFLIEDKPLAYCMTEIEGVERLLWFWFEDYVIFGVVQGTVFPMGEEIFNNKLGEKDNSVIVSADPVELKDKLDKIAIFAETYLDRMNIVVFKDELFLYTLAPSGLEAIDVLPIISNIEEGQIPEFISVNISYFRDEIKECSNFFLGEGFIYFSNEDGVESILKPLIVEDGVSVMERVGEFYNRRNSGIESDTTGMDIGGISSQT